MTHQEVRTYQCQSPIVPSPVHGGAWTTRNPGLQALEAENGMLQATSPRICGRFLIAFSSTISTRFRALSCTASLTLSELPCSAKKRNATMLRACSATSRRATKAEPLQAPGGSSGPGARSRGGLRRRRLAAGGPAGRGCPAATDSLKQL